ncbi:rhodanese-like domain-containing protein [Reichenbachiella ulvae]|uniref:Rhodanese-like domain-containing protein n=1 Tax=Reichenbachiella ulvae TaxID=2980104 RepID=A0ABT3D0I8_9BACT|nr:rhodanese-like domain-containing protein [Reichenbachiella ulvae]MCV9389422.1 rhodanese-like domain-containing protein [Reichenbachiella ulvae]
MNVRQILSVLFLMIGTIAAILPNEPTKYRKFSMEELDQEMKKDMYYFSTDEVAHLIISGDPSFQLIDLRQKADSMINGAINIPADSVLNEKYEGLLYQSARQTILYGDDEARTISAWKDLKFRTYPNVYMLRGGIQAWKSDILNPEHPGISAAQDELDIYERRTAARQYFTGAKAIKKADIQIVLPAGGRKKKKVQGGCS